MGAKYELTTDTIDVGAVTLYRIRALRDIPGACVLAGDIGGYIESEENLGHEGDAWVYGSAQVYGDAQVYGAAQVSGDAQVYDHALVYDDAWVLCDIGEKKC